MMDGRVTTRLLPPVGAVEAGGLIELGVDALQTGHEDDDGVAELDPHEDEHEDRQRAVRAAEPVVGQRSETDLFQERVHGAVFGAEDPAHDDRGHGDGQQLGQVEQGAQEGRGLAAELLLNDVGE